MLKVLGGYTILEVMIFLVISSALLASAMVAIGGSQGHTQFNQGMRDINSKLQSWINEVNQGFPGGANASYKCMITGAGPKIDNGSGSDTPDCIFLGKAIQFTSADSSSGGQENIVYSYSVFGRRLTASGQDLVSNVVEASPVAATATDGSGNADLTDVYNLHSGIKVLSVKHIDSSNNATDSHLIAFYSSFNTDQSAAQNGSKTLRAYNYGLAGNAKPGNQAGVSSTITNCIRMKAASGCEQPINVPDSSWPAALETYQVCFGNDTNSDTALLTVKSNSGLGARITMDFKECS